MRKGLFLAAALIGLWPGVVLAHSSLEGIGSFPNGLIHPVLEPAHAVALLAGALLIAHQPVEKMPRLFLVVVLPMAIGLAAAAAALWVSAPAWVSTGIWICNVILGLSVAATHKRAYWFGPGILTTSFLFLGLDTSLETFATAQRFVFAFGAWLGTALIVVNLTLAIRRLESFPITRFGLRVAGSWIAASGAMILALSLRGAGGH